MTFPTFQPHAVAVSAKPRTFYAITVRSVHLRPIFSAEHALNDARRVTQNDDFPDFFQKSYQRVTPEWLRAT